MNREAKISSTSVSKVVVVLAVISATMLKFIETR